jgi:hypothetical protein
MIKIIKKMTFYVLFLHHGVILEHKRLTKKPAPGRPSGLPGAFCQTLKI